VIAHLVRVVWDVPVEHNFFTTMIQVPIEKQRFCTLTITESCNLNCPYCYEHHKSDRAMSIDLAVKIAEQELFSQNDYEYVKFQFFGGEPFIEFETIRALVEHIKKHEYPKLYSFEITTNGTLLTNEIKKWLIENKDLVYCFLSLDGTREMHNINRSNSFDAIDLSFFSKNYPNCQVKMTVSEKTLPNLFDGVKFCYDNGFQVFWNLGYGINWSNQENAEILSRELKKLIDFHLKTPNITPSAMLSDPISKIVYQKEGGFTQSWCATGLQMVAYSIDGKKYPCQFFSPVTSGEKAIELGNIEIKLDIPDDKLDEKCRSCVIRAVCPTCYGANYYSTGNLYKKDDNLCALMKIILKARSFFLAEKWKQGNFGLGLDDEKLMLKAIVMIQNEL